MSILYIEDNTSNTVIMYKHLTIYVLHHSNEHWKEYVLHCNNIE